MHVLILGGTTEASALAGLLGKRPHIKATLSLAGRTRSPVLPEIAHRIGGFGGVEGLAGWIREHSVTALVDATHPFAKQMPFNAADAARETHIPILSLLRPQWHSVPGDKWKEVSDHAGAIAALGVRKQNVFLTVGRMELAAYAAAPQHHYVVRSVDPVEDRVLPDAVWMEGRGPFTRDGELALFKEHAIDTVITKNSGGSATGAKIDAARELGVPVIMLRRPARPEGERVTTAEEALEWIVRTHAISS